MRTTTVHRFVPIVAGAMLAVTGLLLHPAATPAARAERIPQRAEADVTVAPDLDLLLERLGRSQERLAELYARGEYLVTSQFREFRGRGSRPDSTRTVVTRAYDDDGTPKEEIVRFVEDGKDRTEERRARPIEKPRMEKLPYHNPFAPDRQAEYRFRLDGPAEDDPSLAVVAFSPKRKTADNYVGRAWIDPQDGTLHRLSFRIADRPTFVSKHDVDIRFEAETPYGPAVSELKVDAAGGALFLRKRVKVVTTIGDYRPPRG